MHPDWHIVEYRGREALVHLEADWRRLAASLPLRTAFHAHEAHLAYFELLMAAPEKFRCLALNDGEKVRAIVPLEARREPALAGVPVWAVPRHPHITMGDVICPEGEARRVLLPLLFEHVRANAKGRPLLLLGPLPASSLLWEGLEHLPRGRRYAHSTMSASIFDTSRSYEEIMARLSKHFRRNLRAHRRKLESLEGIRRKTVRGDDIREECERFLDLEAAGWKGRSKEGLAIRRRPGHPEFYSRLAATLGSDGGGDHCEINTLSIGDRLLAAQLCMHTGAQYSIAKIAYDEAYSRLSPGLLLLEETLQRCCENPDVQRLNLQSSGGWQEDWRPDLLGMQQVYLATGKIGAPFWPAMLSLRFGPGLRLVNRLRRQSAALEGVRRRFVRATHRNQTAT